MHLRAKLEVSASRRLRCAFVPPPPDRNSRVFPPRRPNPPPQRAQAGLGSSWAAPRTHSGESKVGPTAESRHARDSSAWASGPVSALVAPSHDRRGCGSGRPGLVRRMPARSSKCALLLRRGECSEKRPAPARCRATLGSRAGRDSGRPAPLATRAVRAARHRGRFASTGLGCNPGRTWLAYTRLPTPGRINPGVKSCRLPESTESKHKHARRPAHSEVWASGVGSPRSSSRIASITWDQICALHA